MAKLLKLRRGTTSQHSSFTGAEGEVTVDTDKESLVVHNGSNAGGYPLAREDMSNVSSASIAGRLATDSIAPAKIGAGSLPTDVTIVTDNLGNEAVTNAKLGDLSINNAKVAANAAIAYSKLADISANRVLGRSNAGSVEATQVQTGMMADGAVTGAKIADDAVTYAKMQNTANGARLLGKVSSGGGEIQEQTKAEVLTFLNVEDGATADQTASEILTAIKTVDGTGSGLDADTLDGKQDTDFLRANSGGGAASYNATADITFSGGGGAATIAANSDISFTTGDWTGNHCKIQHHGDKLYIIGGSDGIRLREGGTDRWIMDGSGHFLPNSDSTYNIGANGTRVANGYFDTLYGDGSNLTGVQPFPSGTKMIFQQSAAPTGWTKITSSVDNKALRLVSGNVGSGGNTGFTTAFASYTPAGNVGASGNSTASFSANATSGNSTATTGNAGATNTGNSAPSTSSVSTSGNVNNHTLSTNQMPSHSHNTGYGQRDDYGNHGDFRPQGRQGQNWYGGSVTNYSSGNTGGGGSHSHGFSGSSHSHNVNNHTHSISQHTHNVNNHTHSVSVSGNTGNHTHNAGSFSGSARDFAVTYIDVIVASKD
tara:strand:+ start:7402 stop:9195 length:1794 start_codon:yes stop_codon:yes gene_type:complete